MRATSRVRPVPPRLIACTCCGSSTSMVCAPRGVDLSASTRRKDYLRLAVDLYLALRGRGGQEGDGQGRPTRDGQNQRAARGQALPARPRDAVEGEVTAQRARARAAAPGQTDPVRAGRHRHLVEEQVCRATGALVAEVGADRGGRPLVHREG